jgi:Domain of unknown function (DUF1851)
MTLDDLTVSFSHLDRDRLLNDWTWLIGVSKLPILLTASGNAFLQDRDDGSIHVLDVGDGRVHKVAGSVEALSGLLVSRDFVATNFAVQRIGNLRASGRALPAGSIYSFKKLPILGGEYDLANFEVTDIEVHFSIAGQLHERVAALPVGTVVNRVTIS